MALALATAAVSFGVVRARAEHLPIPKGPNVVMIMTDDQTLEAMRFLPEVTSLIADEGTSFTNYAVSFPNCCPSRATYLTGQYSHNTGVQDNVKPDGGFAKLRSDQTLPVWLHDAGYITASVGKYLNTWGDGGKIQPPPGWDHWYSLIDPSTYHYFGYDVSVNGKRVHFGKDPKDYSTDVLAAEAVRFIGSRANKERPFFLSFTPLAPHAAAPEQRNGVALGLALPVPAPRYQGTRPDALPPKTASYNQADTSKLPKDVKRPLIKPDIARFIQHYYQAEMETLLAVNDAVKGIYDELTRTGLLANTVIMFTSDNGLFHGEHRLTSGKFYLYEPAVHLPLFIRGGPFKAGAVVSQPASNVDLAPTVLALTGVTQDELLMDGRSLVPLAADPKVGADRGVLLENRKGHGKAQTWGIRTTRWKYLEDLAGEKELYDLQTDPDEVVNLAGTRANAAIQAQLTDRLHVLRGCKGATCEDSDASRAGKKSGG